MVGTALDAVCISFQDVEVPDDSVEAALSVVEGALHSVALSIEYILLSDEQVLGALSCVAVAFDLIGISYCGVVVPLESVGVSLD